MARDNTQPAYSSPEADQTGTRTAVNEGDTTVTEAQADQGTTQESGAEKDLTAQQEAAQKQADEDSQARIEAEKNGTFVHREANPNVGGESFPTFAPPKK